MLNNFSSFLSANKLPESLIQTLLAIEEVSKTISSHVRQAGIIDNLGATGNTNTHGDVVQRLDVFANELFVNTLSSLSSTAILGSEEMEKEIMVNKKGEYTIFFDPLDGSKNIDVNITIGSIFSIYKTDSGLLQKGDSQIAAGYTLYGPQTMLVVATGNGVNGFTLDPKNNAFVLTHKNIKIPSTGATYSINESNSLNWNDSLQKYIEHLKTKGNFSARYVGSLVADVHRTLLKGGIFFYPQDKKNTAGKLRLVYEVLPMAFILEQSGGKTLSGTNNSLDLVPDSLHQKAPVVLGSQEIVEEYLKFLKMS